MLLDEDDTELMRKNGIFLVPTLSYGTHVKELGDKSGLPDYIIEKAINGLHYRLKSFEKALKLSVGSMLDWTDTKPKRKQ